MDKLFVIQRLLGMTWFNVGSVTAPSKEAAVEKLGLRPATVGFQLPRTKEIFSLTELKTISSEEELRKALRK